MSPTLCMTGEAEKRGKPTDQGAEEDGGTGVAAWPIAELELLNTLRGLAEESTRV